MAEPHLLKVVVHRGAVAAARLRSAEFQAEWSALLEACPWATVFQGPLFAEPWLAVYGSAWDLAAVEARREGQLDGLLLLGAPASGEWTHLGGIHAEYHAWLARDGGAAVPQALLRAARQAVGLRTLRWLFLPPGAVASALVSGPGVTIVRPQPQPVRVLSGAPPPGSSLRSKRNRLRKRGLLVVDRPAGIAEREAFLEEFIPLHEARHEAIGHGRAFDLDPRKRDYYRASLRVPGLLDVTGLRLDGALIAGHIGVRNGPALVLGMLAHATALDAESPGQVLLHELGPLALASGIRELDLTPGGAYKSRFATDFREAWAVDQAWGLRHAGWLRLRYDIVLPAVRQLRGVADRLRRRRG